MKNLANKIGKTLKNLLYGVIPITIASFLPMNEAKGQIAKIENPNTIYLTFQPGDFGLGVRYDRRISQFGVYSSLSKGNYKLPNEIYIKNHVKVALGGLFYLREKYVDSPKGFFNFGLSYHNYGEKSDPLKMINEKAFKPLSIEIGVGVRTGHFSSGMRIDPLKWEGALDFGISF